MKTTEINNQLELTGKEFPQQFQKTPRNFFRGVF